MLLVRVVFPHEGEVTCAAKALWEERLVFKHVPAPSCADRHQDKLPDLVRTFTCSKHSLFFSLAFFDPGEENDRQVLLDVDLSESKEKRQHQRSSEIPNRRELVSLWRIGSFLLHE